MSKLMIGTVHIQVNYILKLFLHISKLWKSDIDRVKGLAHGPDSGNKAEPGFNSLIFWILLFWKHQQ